MRGFARKPSVVTMIGAKILETGRACAGMANALQSLCFATQTLARARARPREQKYSPPPQPPRRAAGGPATAAAWAALGMPFA